MRVQLASRAPHSNSLTRDLTPDMKLPDLVVPGRGPAAAPSQAEFVQVPATYVRETSIARLAKDGQRLRQTHAATLAAIEKRFGVPPAIILAIWGRETDFGRHKLPYDGIRVLATQAYVGRRAEQFRAELIAAMKLIQNGDVTRAELRTSWAGATGLTQFLPTELAKHGVDLDGDGHINIWTSVPDALASAAQQLRNKGWQPGLPWAYEVKAPASGDCSQGVAEITRPISDWLQAGYTPVRTQRLQPTARAQSASLLQPEGIYGPAFLTTANYFVIKEYNFSDLYVIFVGHLADRIDGASGFVTPWAATEQLRTSDVEETQRHLTRLGLYTDKIDGKAGMKTRAAVGAYQKSVGLKLDCWPSKAVLRSLKVTR